MCGIIGVYLKNVTPRQLAIIEKIIIQSGIRGVHATGISYLKNGKITINSSHTASPDFMKEISLKDCIDADGGLYLIAHTRYSTSDLKWNQPIGDSKLSICHNGVISQESPKKWKKLFGLNTQTTNDSELIYACIKLGKDPLEYFDGSMAVCTLTNKKLVAFRNHERPLWYSTLKNGIIFASTNNILIRSGLKNNIKCEMYKRYTFDGKFKIIPVKIPLMIKDLQ